MLLSEAQRFERIVKQQTKAEWSKPEKCVKFVQKLMSAAEKLTTKNRRLRSLHRSIRQQIANLTKINLLTNFSKWQKVIADVKSIFQNEERCVL